MRCPPNGRRPPLQTRSAGPDIAEEMGFSPAPNGPGTDRQFRLGLLVALSAVGIATVAAVLRGIGEMTTLSRIALIALYAAFGVVLSSTVGTFRRQRRQLSAAE